MKKGMPINRPEATEFLRKRGSNLAIRIFLVALGAVVMAFGIALAKHSATGTAPISTLPAVVTEICHVNGLGGFTMGVWLFTFNVIYFLLEIILLRRQFNPIQVLQLPLVFVLSAAVDQWLGLFNLIFPLDYYLLRLLYLVLSIVILALGIRIHILADLVLTPADALVLVVSYKSKKRFSGCKVAFDVSISLIAATLSLIYFHGLLHVREGTVISSLFVGTMVGFWGKAIERLDWLVPQVDKPFIPPIVPPEPQEGE